MSYIPTTVTGLCEAISKLSDMSFTQVYMIYGAKKKSSIKRGRSKYYSRQAAKRQLIAIYYKYKNSKNQVTK